MTIRPLTTQGAQGEAQRSTGRQARRLSARIGRLAARIIIPGAVALFIAAGSYAYFTASGSGSGSDTGTVVTLNAPFDPSDGPVFDLTNMEPGDSSSQTATITANGGGATASQVLLYQENVTGTLAAALNLEIVEDGSTVVYNGLLANSPTAASPLAIPGSHGSLWNAGEEHTFTFTVSFPVGATNNSFQNANATLDFVWEAEES